MASNIRGLESQVDYHWNEMKNSYPGFAKPVIVPAATMRQTAPMYMKRYIDQDPNSFYMFLQGDMRKGDVSREAAMRFFDDLFYNRLHMPSSYDQAAGGQYDRIGAINKEVLPAQDDANFTDFYQEQEAVAEQAGAAESTPAPEAASDIIDMDFDDATGMATPRNVGTTAVGSAQTTAVEQPKPIFYAVDFHVPAGGYQLGHDRGANGLNGRSRRTGIGRGSYGMLREKEKETAADELDEAGTTMTPEEFFEPVINEKGNGGLPGGLPSVDDTYIDDPETDGTVAKIRSRRTDGTASVPVIPDSLDDEASDEEMAADETAAARRWEKNTGVRQMKESTGVKLRRFDRMMREALEKKEEDVDEAVKMMTPEEFFKPVKEDGLVGDRPHNLHKKLHEGMFDKFYKHVPIKTPSDTSTETVLQREIRLAKESAGKKLYLPSPELKDPVELIQFLLKTTALAEDLSEQPDNSKADWLKSSPEGLEFYAPRYLNATQSRAVFDQIEKMSPVEFFQITSSLADGQLMIRSVANDASDAEIADKTRAGAYLDDDGNALEEAEEFDEDDLLRDRPHNGHVSARIKKILEGTDEDVEECDKCGDPNCRDGELCGLNEYCTDDEIYEEEIDTRPLNESFVRFANRLTRII